MPKLAASQQPSSSNKSCPCQPARTTAKDFMRCAASSTLLGQPASGNAWANPYVELIGGFGEPAGVSPARKQDSKHLESGTP